MKDSWRFSKSSRIFNSLLLMQRKIALLIQMRHSGVIYSSDDIVGNERSSSRIEKLLSRCLRHAFIVRLRRSAIRE